MGQGLKKMLLNGGVNLVVAQPTLPTQARGSGGMLLLNSILVHSETNTI